MTKRFAVGKKALGICDVCGFQFKLKDLRYTIVKRKRTNTLVCRECDDVDHPQLFIGEVRIDDPQALQNPRPDSGEYAASRETVTPIQSVPTVGFIGTVVVTTS